MDIQIRARSATAAVRILLNERPRMIPKRKKRLFEMGSTFLLDASVLIFIFVPLDVVIQFGRKGMTLPFLLASLGASALLFAIAVIIAIAGDES